MQVEEGNWALILGASSGFGEAVSLELARNGYHIIGVHLDRKATMPQVDNIITAIRDMGRKAEFFNGNAADEEYRNHVLDEVQSRLTYDLDVAILVRFPPGLLVVLLQFDEELEYLGREVALARRPLLLKTHNLTGCRSLEVGSPGSRVHSPTAALPDS